MESKSSERLKVAYQAAIQELKRTEEKLNNLQNDLNTRQRNLTLEPDFQFIVDNLIREANILKMMTTTQVSDQIPIKANFSNQQPKITQDSEEGNPLPKQPKPDTTAHALEKELPTTHRTVNLVDEPISFQQNNGKTSKSFYKSPLQASKYGLSMLQSIIMPSIKQSSTFPSKVQSNNHRDVQAIHLDKEIIQIYPIPPATGKLDIKTPPFSNEEFSPLQLSRPYDKNLDTNDIYDTTKGIDAESSFSLVATTTATTRSDNDENDLFFDTVATDGSNEDISETISQQQRRVTEDRVMADTTTTYDYDHHYGGHNSNFAAKNTHPRSQFYTSQDNDQDFDISLSVSVTPNGISTKEATATNKSQLKKNHQETPINSKPLYNDVTGNNTSLPKSRLNSNRGNVNQEQPINRKPLHHDVTGNDTLLPKSRNANKVNVIQEQPINKKHHDVTENDTSLPKSRNLNKVNVNQKPPINRKPLHHDVTGNDTSLPKSRNSNKVNVNQDQPINRKHLHHDVTGNDTSLPQSRNSNKGNVKQEQPINRKPLHHDVTGNDTSLPQSTNSNKGNVKQEQPINRKPLHHDVTGNDTSSPKSRLNSNKVTVNEDSDSTLQIQPKDQLKDLNAAAMLEDILSVEYRQKQTTDGRNEPSTSKGKGGKPEPRRNDNNREIQKDIIEKDYQIPKIIINKVDDGGITTKIAPVVNLRSSDPKDGLQFYSNRDGTDNLEHQDQGQPSNNTNRFHQQVVEASHGRNDHRSSNAALNYLNLHTILEQLIIKMNKLDRKLLAAQTEANGSNFPNQSQGLKINDGKMKADFKSKTVQVDLNHQSAPNEQNVEHRSVATSTSTERLLPQQKLPNPNAVVDLKYEKPLKKRNPWLIEQRTVSTSMPTEHLQDEQRTLTYPSKAIQVDMTKEIVFENVFRRPIELKNVGTSTSYEKQERHRQEKTPRFKSQAVQTETKGQYKPNHHRNDQNSTHVTKRQQPSRRDSSSIIIKEAKQVVRNAKQMDRTTSTQSPKFKFKSYPQNLTYWREQADHILRTLVKDNAGNMKHLNRQLEQLPPPPRTEVTPHQSQDQEQQNDNGSWPRLFSDLFEMLVKQKNCNPYVWAGLTPYVDLEEAVTHLTKERNINSGHRYKYKICYLPVYTGTDSCNSG